MATPPAGSLLDEVARAIVSAGLGLADAATAAATGFPVQVRLRTRPWRLPLGQVDLLRIEVGGVVLRGLPVERLRIKARNLTFRPGLQPRATAGPVEMRITVTDAGLRSWAERMRLPWRLRVTEEGIVAAVRIGDLTVQEVAVELVPRGRLLGLRARRAEVLGVPAPLVGLVRGVLPLPPLPRGARLVGVRCRLGAADLDIEVPSVEVPLAPDALSRLRRELGGR